MAGLESYVYSLIVLNYATLAIGKHLVEDGAKSIDSAADELRKGFLSDGAFVVLEENIVKNKYPSIDKMLANKDNIIAGVSNSKQMINNDMRAAAVSLLFGIAACAVLQGFNIILYIYKIDLSLIVPALVLNLRL
jgi:hypothetical protein